MKKRFFAIWFLSLLCLPLLAEKYNIDNATLDWEDQFYRNTRIKITLHGLIRNGQSTVQEQKRILIVLMIRCNWRAWPIG